MRLYRQKMEMQLKNNRQQIEILQRYKDFYPLIEELIKVFKRGVWPQPNDSYLHASIYLNGSDDKTLPLLIEEFIIDKDWIEQAEESKSYKEQGEIIFYFYSTKPRFGSGERPKLKLCVDYSNLCKRVATGTRVVKDYEYVCD